MARFFDENREHLQAFVRISNAVGVRCDYVQGGGGNTSVKLENGWMAIKASGYCLKDITTTGAYAVLDGAALKRFYRESDPEALDDVEKAGSERAKALVKSIEGLPALRPSVESGFHSLLDTYVIHSHSVYCNLATCTTEGRRIVAEALGDAPYAWGFVPYTDPGARLTFSIRDELARVERVSGVRPSVIFMQNHGVIVHGDDADACLRLHEDVNERIAAAFGTQNGEFPPVTFEMLPDGTLRAHAPIVSEAIASGRCSEAFFLKAPLYPDQQVFLTGSFRFGEEPEEGFCTANPSEGALLCRMNASKAQVIVETLACVAFIAETLRAKGLPVTAMDAAARDFLANWESEKYRKSLAGK